MKSPEIGSNGVKSEVMGRFLQLFSGNPHQSPFVLIGISTGCLPGDCASLYTSLIFPLHPDYPLQSLRTSQAEPHHKHNKHIDTSLFSYCKAFLGLSIIKP